MQSMKPQVKYIRKRSGELAVFKQEKITIAIAKAGKATGEFGLEAAEEMSGNVHATLVDAAVKDRIPTVEEVQDLVEAQLAGKGFVKTAKAYILYRDQHARIRGMGLLPGIEMVEAYLSKLDWRVRENSNMGYSLQGLNNFISGQISETYWLNKIYTQEVRRAHEAGDLHIHDLSQLSVYCVGWDLYDLLEQGFRGVAGKVESNPAKHFRTALGQIVNFFYTLQGEAAGAQAFSNFDTLLAPFIRADGLSYASVKQALQEFVFNVNVPTRVGFQTPFTNISLDIMPPAALKDRKVMMGGKLHETTYGEYQAEMHMLNRALLEVLTEGDAKGRVFTFPIPTYNITKDFDWDAEIFTYLWKATAKYGIAYFANFVNSDMSPDDARSMCCRLRLDKRELIRRGGGLFGSNPLTGSIGVVTLNMPRLGYKSSDESSFIDNLRQLMEISCTSLETKRKALESLTDKGLYPYSKFYLRHLKEKDGRYWNNHFSTIGLVGLNEACQNLFGCNLATEKGRQFAVRVMDCMRETIQEFQERTGHLFNLEATPAEGASYRLAKLDKEEYGDILNANPDKEGAPFYSNSSQLPAGFSSDLFEVLDLQDELQTKYTGGTVQHIFLGESMPDEASVKGLVRKVCSQYKLPYFTITPTFSICSEHGYISGEAHECPTCGAETEVYSRVVGYLRPISQWNAGKQEEFKARSLFNTGDCR